MTDTNIGGFRPTSIVYEDDDGQKYRRYMTDAGIKEERL